MSKQSAKQRHARREARRTERLMKAASKPIPEILKGNRRRALLAAIACTFVAIAVLACVVSCLVIQPSDLHPERGIRTFRLFTVFSNLVSATGCLLAIPFAVEGIRKNTYHIPEWCVTLHYMGATSVAITFIFAIFLILPFKGTYLAFGGPNFYMHLVCPVLCILAFLFLQSEHRMRWPHSLIALVPFVVYATIYFIKVVATGEGAGGWRDVYQLNTMVSVWISLPIMVCLALFVSRSLGILHNLISSQQALMDKRIAIALADETPGETSEAEAAELARTWAESSVADSYIVIPRVLLEDLSRKAGDGRSTESLCLTYLSNYLDALNNREEAVKKSA